MRQESSIRFGPKPGELAEKTPTGKPTEEFQCARFIDGLPEVKFWKKDGVVVTGLQVRNTSNIPGAIIVENAIIAEPGKDLVAKKMPLAIASEQVEKIDAFP